MTAEEFEQQVIAGQITDFEPYLNDTGSIKEDLSAIEATMSPEQLYEAGSPLWTQGLNIEAIYLFAYLVPIMASENVPLTNYMDDYVRDCKNGMNASVARDRQLQKYGI